MDSFGSNRIARAEIGMPAKAKRIPFWKSPMENWLSNKTAALAQRFEESKNSHDTLLQSRVFHGLIERISMLLDERTTLMDKYSFKWIRGLRILSDTLKHKAMEWVLVSAYGKTELEAQKPSTLKQIASRTRNSIKLCCRGWMKLFFSEAFRCDLRSSAMVTHAHIGRSKGFWGVLGRCGTRWCFGWTNVPSWRKSRIQMIIRVFEQMDIDEGFDK